MSGPQFGLRCETIVRATGNWLARYRAGERGQVWDDLARLGGAVREPHALEEVQFVGDEMARRARHNVEVIVERLTRYGSGCTPTTTPRTR